LKIKNAYDSKNKIILLFNKVNVIRGTTVYEFNSIRHLINNKEFGINRGLIGSFVFSIRPIETVYKKDKMIKFICECQKIIVE